MHLASAPSLFSELAYDFNNHLFYLEEDEKSSHLGFGYVFPPMPGCDHLTTDKLSVLFNQSFPDNTLLQISLWSSPDLTEPINRILALRSEATGVFKTFTEEKVAYLYNAISHELDTISELKLRDIQCILTVKVPVKANFTEIDKENINRLRLNTEQILKTTGIYGQPLTPNKHLRMMETIFNWSADASWRITPSDTHYDPTMIMADQMMDLSTMLEIKADGLKVKDKYIHILSPKRYPEYITTGMAMRYAGDYEQGSRGLREPFLITASLYFPAAEKVRQKLELKRQFITKQAHGPLLDFVPRMAVQKHDMDDFFEALDKGDRPCKFMLTFAVFGDKKRKADAAAANMKTYFQELGFTLMEDAYFCKPLFLNMLPFGADPKLIRDVVRYKTMATNHAARMVPMMADWKGTGNAAMQFVSRTGQLMNMDLFDSGTNYNAIIAAQSGSGKSFMTNDIIMSYLSMGAKIWTIDVGRSYLKLSESIDGVFMAFAPESNICLNPFDIIKDYSEVSDVLVGLISAMAAQHKPLSDLQEQQLRKTLKEQWDIHKNALTIDIISETLIDHQDRRIQDIGNQLYSFTSKGEYGRYFSGKNNINLDNPFTVLELEELKGRKHLQQVVLLQLIYQIQQEMYLGELDRPKILIIDEAWALLTEGAIGKFIEDSYRRVRKYGGAVIVVTQSVNDLYQSSGGAAIVENSANMYLLRQKAEVIEAMKREKKLPVHEGGYDLIKSVHTNPGRYSEIFFMTEMGAGIGRLYVNRFCQLLYSTKSQEVYALQQIRKENNCSIEVAINEYIRRESK